MILLPLFDLKFLTEFAAIAAGTSNRRHWRQGSCDRVGAAPPRGSNLLFLFDNYTLDCDRCELRRGADLVSLEPKVFDLLAFLVRNRERVVSRDDLIAQVWAGRIVSESALASCINAARSALADSGDEQRLI